MNEKRKATIVDAREQLINELARERARSQAWSRSMSEEVLSILYFIGAVEAYSVGCRWAAAGLCLKAILDMMAALRCAVSELRKIRQEVREQVLRDL